MTRFLSIALLSLYTFTAQADIYSASNALSRGDYETAVKEFTKLAEQGDANAQANLGYMYYAGEGVPQNFETAVYWYRKAATQGNRDAQYNLAVSYAFGEGTKQDLTEAAIWYRRAGEQGHVVSQYSLGISYAYGEGVPQDQKEAARWFMKAAEQGYARAQVHLGSMYHTGEGVEQNYSEAVRWYRLAADRGDATAQYNLGAMYRSGKGVEQNYAQAKRWFRQSSDQGYAAATNELASLERSAAANVATRTIQAKPKMPSVAETTPTPEPTPEIKEEVIEESVAEEIITQEVELPQQIVKETIETKKEPLFSVEKEGLLTLDESVLEISKTEISPDVVTETPAEPETIEEVIAETETPVETIEEPTSEENLSPIHNAPGIPTPEETNIADEETEKSEGFFSKLFSKKESSDTGEAYLFDQEEIAAEYSSDVIHEDIAEDDIDEPVEETNIAEEETDSSGGFFNKLFSSKESTDTEEDVIEEIDSPEVEAIAEVVEEEPIEEVIAETETPVETIEESSTEERPSPIHNALGIAAPEETNIADEETEKAEGFFSKLFSKKESSDTGEAYLFDQEEIAAEYSSDVIHEDIAEDDIDEPVEETNIAEEETDSSGGFFDKLFSSKESTDIEEATEEIVESEVEAIAEVVEEEPVEEAQIEVEKETTVAENNWAEQEDNSANEENESESSDGFFSAIGNLFSGNKKESETSELDSSNEDEDIVIAKAEEPATIPEEIELAEQAESDINQYTITSARDELSSSNFEEAYKQFQVLADAGNNEAQAHLGSLYYVGKGVNKDLDLAYVWYKKAADQGNVDAQYSIGNMYLLGEGVEQSNTDAAEWYRLASDQGHHAAKNNLANLEKLEAINKENQLKQDAIAAEQKAKKEAAKNEELKETEHEQEVAAEIESSETDYIATEEAEVSKEDKESGFFSRLFGGKSDDEQESKVDLEIEEEIEVSETEVVETDEVSVNVAEDTEPEKVSDEVETIKLASNEQSELITDIPTVEEEEKSPGFFSRLFGSDSNDEQASELNTEAEIETDAVETEKAVNETDTSIAETAVIEPEAALEEPEAIELASNEESELITDIPNVEEEESPGFFSRLFGSSDEKDDATEEIALAEVESVEVTTDDLEESISEDIVEEVSALTEVDRIRPLATQGDANAQYQLGTLYYSGNGVTQDYSQAALWYRRAAQQGNVDAQYSLGNMYLMGEGIGQDDGQAAEWYTMAAEQGHSSAKHNLDSLQKTSVASNTEFVEDTSNTSQLISLDNTPASNIDNDSAKAIYEQGLAYAFGDGVPQNDRTAFNLFYEAAEKGFVLAQYKLGVAFAYGEGVRQDNKQAADWYRKAAEQGYIIAQRNLATMYLNGNGVEQNKVQALAWYEVVANAGNAMDLHRRDRLKSELSEVELNESLQLAKQINNRITNPSL